MENWKNVEPEFEAPKVIKKDVESSLGFFRGAGRMIDLYLGKIGWLFGGMLRGYHVDEDPAENTPDQGSENDAGQYSPDI